MAYPFKTFKIQEFDHHYYKNVLFHKLNYEFLENNDNVLFYKVVESLEIKDKFLEFRNYVNLERGIIVRINEKEIKVSSNIESKIEEEISVLKEWVKKLKHPKKLEEIKK